MTVSIEEYRAGWNDFTIEGEYVKPDGSEGLIVKSRYGSFYAIRNASRSDYRYFESLPDAQRDMEKHGFTLRVPQEARDVTEYLREREAQVTVQGRTLAEWEEQGKLNESRLPKERVNPVMPTDRDETEDEKLAYVNSMTPMEAAIAMGVAGFAAQKEVTKKTRRPRRQRVSA